MRGRLTPHACEMNQQVAVIAIESVLEEPHAVWGFDEITLSRMVACGRCPDSEIDLVRAKKSFNSILDLLESQLTKTLDFVEDQKPWQYQQK